MRQLTELSNKSIIHFLKIMSIIIFVEFPSISHNSFYMRLYSKEPVAFFPEGGGFPAALVNFPDADHFVCRLFKATSRPQRSSGKNGVSRKFAVGDSGDQQGDSGNVGFTIM